ncbi:MAG: ATP synthase subunit I [Candidatus Rokubacteria bacterium]|nr:ATP synthase subunit I [Candidatus Rokubacteria bacterium]
MTPSEFGARVMIGGALAGSVLALLAACGWGAHAFGGVAVGAAVALLNFAWLARGVALVAGTPGGRRPGVRWVLALGTRYLLTFTALATPVALEWAHPVALGLGVTVLPLLLTTQGLHAARRMG